MILNVFFPLEPYINESDCVVRSFEVHSLEYFEVFKFFKFFFWWCWSTAPSISSVLIQLLFAEQNHFYKNNIVVETEPNSQTPISKILLNFKMCCDILPTLYNINVLKCTIHISWIWFLTIFQSSNSGAIIL